jgi:hypothetical protein
VAEQRLEPLARALDGAGGAALGAVAELADGGEEVGADRHRKLGGGGGGGRAHVGSEVAQGGVGLVATAEMVGMGDSATARTTTSSLNAHRSSTEPPPRATMMRSGRGTEPPG